MLLRTPPDGHKDTPGGQGRHKSRLLGEGQLKGNNVEADPFSEGHLQRWKESESKLTAKRTSIHSVYSVYIYRSYGNRNVFEALAND